MKKSSLFIVALLCSISYSWGQNKTPQSTTVFIPVDQTPAIDYRYHDGTAILADGTVLKGRFQYNGRSSFLYRASGQAPQQKFGFSYIRRLSLSGADTLISPRRDSTIFVQMGRRLYRQLTDGTTMVLDQKFAVDEERGKIGRKIFVIDDTGDFHSFTSLQKLNKWFSAFKEQSGKKLPDIYLNENEIVKAVAKLNDD